MKEYRVLWEIDVTAETPEAAAKQASEMQRDPATLATVFHVYNNIDRRKTVDVRDL